MEPYDHTANLEIRRALCLPLTQELEPSVQTLLAHLGLETHNALAAKPQNQLLADLYNSNWEVRVAAVCALGLLSTSEKRGIAERLIELLHDKVGSVRLAIVRVLSTLGQDVPVQALIKAFCNSEWSVRTAIVFALKDQGERVPSWFFIHALRDENGFVRAAALRALDARGLITIDLLASALYDREWHVREVAALMLGNLNEQISEEILLEALHDTEEPVRKAALFSSIKLKKNMPLRVLADVDEHNFHRRLEDDTFVWKRRSIFFILRRQLGHFLANAKKLSPLRLFLQLLLGLSILGLVFVMWTITRMDLYLIFTLLTVLVTLPSMIVSSLQLAKWKRRQRHKKV